MNKLFYKLKYGNFPSCLHFNEDEHWNFILYNFMWDMLRLYYSKIENTHLDTFSALSFQSVTLASRAIEYIVDSKDPAHSAERNMNVIKERLNLPIKDCEEYLNYWISITEEML